jgi:hypothetical protein
MSIVAGLAFSTSTGRFKGVALPSIEAIGSVTDVFEHISDWDTSQKLENSVLASKVLQFLWRDACSSLQLIGPFYELPESGVSVKQLHVIVRDVVRAFHCLGIYTRVISCDGAPVNRCWMRQVLSGGVSLRDLISVPSATPSNLRQVETPKRAPEHIESLINAREQLSKALERTNESCVHSISEDIGKMICQVPSSSTQIVATRHWFDPNSMLFIIVDPTHQMKSMRNQLLGEAFSLHDICIH